MEFQAKDISRMSCKKHYGSHETACSCWSLLFIRKVNITLEFVIASQQNIQAGQHVVRCNEFSFVIHKTHLKLYKRNIE